MECGAWRDAFIQAAGSDCLIAALEPARQLCYRGTVNEGNESRYCYRLKLQTPFSAFSEKAWQRLRQAVSLN
jgi:hypothetical protein